MKTRMYLFVAILCAALMSASVVAQEIPRRVALVIGNSAYATSKLANPANDAKAMADALDGLGFEVTKKTDRTKAQIENDIDAVTENLRRGDVCLVFFAGHGVSSGNVNYLVPLNATITRQHHIRERCVSLSYLVSALEDSNASLKVVILDCCRDNPFRSFTRSKSRGLARVAAPDGTVIAFSTAPGRTALEGDGKNSPFTKHLVSTLKSKHPNGLTLVGLLENTAIAVRKETGQRGYLERDISMDRFFLKPPASGSQLLANNSSNKNVEKPGVDPAGNSIFDQLNPLHLKKHQKAVFKFDIQADQLITEFKAIGFEQFDNLKQTEFLRYVSFADVKRAAGFASLPHDIEAIKAFGNANRNSQEFPFEFLIRVQFYTAEACQKMQTGAVTEAGAQEIEIGERKFIKPGPGKAPPNLVCRRVDPTTFEFGTTRYCFQSDQSFVSSNLDETWKTIGEQPFRLAIELRESPGLVREYIDLAKEGGEPASAPYFELLKNVEFVTLAVAPNQTNMLDINAQLTDDATTEEFRSALDSMLGTLKIAARMNATQTIAEVPTAKPALDSILKNLTATSRNRIVSIVIRKPEGIRPAVVAITNTARRKADEVDKTNRFKNVALGILNYESTHLRFPFVVDHDKRANDDISWRTRILPYVEEIQVYDQMDLAKGPTEVPNAQFKDRMPEVFGKDGSNSDISWIQSPVKQFRNITDGSASTAMLIENRHGEPWMENQHVTIEEAIKMVKTLADGDKLLFVRYDGTTVAISNRIDETTLRNFLDPSDGNRLPDFIEE